MKLKRQDIDLSCRKFGQWYMSFWKSKPLRKSTSSDKTIKEARLTFKHNYEPSTFACGPFTATFSCHHPLLRQASFKVSRPSKCCLLQANSSANSHDRLEWARRQSYGEQFWSWLSARISVDQDAFSNTSNQYHLPSRLKSLKFNKKYINKVAG